MRIYQELSDNYISIMLGTCIMSSIICYIILKTSIIKKIHTRLIRLKNKFYKTIIIDVSGLDQLYEHVINRDDKKVYEHFCTNITQNNMPKYINFINTNLSEHKNNIIEILVGQAILAMNDYNESKIDYPKYYYWIMHPIIFSHTLDYIHTIKIFEENNKNINSNTLRMTLNLFLGGNMITPYKNEIKELTNKINELETHIKYMPGGDGYNEAKKNFEKLAKK